jgi:hypothetical protein
MMQALIVDLTHARTHARLPRASRHTSHARLPRASRRTSHDITYHQHMHKDAHINQCRHNCPLISYSLSHSEIYVFFFDVNWLHGRDQATTNLLCHTATHPHIHPQATQRKNIRYQRHMRTDRHMCRMTPTAGLESAAGCSQS